MRSLYQRPARYTRGNGNGNGHYAREALIFHQLA
ncbi:hypothetical protein XCCB100_1523 [Xanthomonas campestris pv. campestris]|uniref:Uncharacterized protein n=1 Tax=Xanthomonas campestris pv. campestris (strain B100) TaxID=509169 RepID=B0RQY8_XANCB|nr:hypothetical protein XCCB100_1523 [Xanthomonas campestris pv. campestris]